MTILVSVVQSSVTNEVSSTRAAGATSPVAVRVTWGW